MALVLFSKSIYFVFFLKRITTPGRIFHDRWSRHTSPLLSVWLRVPGENLNKKMFKKMRASSQVSERAGGESRVADTGSLSSPADILCHSILTSSFSSSSRLNFTVFYSNLTLSTLLYYALLHASLLYYSYAPLLYFDTLSCANTLCLILLFYFTKKKGKS